MEVHKGLADVVVSETSLSAIVEGQLSYSGYNIDELVEKMHRLRKSSFCCGIQECLAGKNLRS